MLNLIFNYQLRPYQYLIINHLLIQQEILLSHCSAEYGINLKLIDILYNSDTSNLTKIATTLLGPVEPLVETRQFLDNEEKIATGNYRYWISRNRH